MLVSRENTNPTKWLCGPFISEELRPLFLGGRRTQVCASPTKPVHFCKEFQYLSVKEISTITNSNPLDLEAGNLPAKLAVFREGKPVPL